jgi:hypothetical protein
MNPFFIQLAKSEIAATAKKAKKMLRRYESKTEPSTENEHVEGCLKELLCYCYANELDFSAALRQAEKEFARLVRNTEATPDPEGPRTDDSDEIAF